ncbi:MAG: GAF domain-containing protein [Phycisphaeraceae bacterium]|nr:MAG: GAF domain-containing protein [Phycisphaeraceae bacterium]
MKPRSLSITDFITDGSLFRLCELFSSVADAPVFVRDVRGRDIVGLRNGRLVYRTEEDEDETSSALRRTDPDGAVATGASVEFVAPLVAASQQIGAIVMPAPPGFDAIGAGGEPDVFRRMIRHLAQTVSEACDREVAQRQRAEELQALYRLSSLLVGAGGVDAMLDAGLRSAIEVLEADAGAVRLYEDDDGHGLRVRASVGLGESGQEPCEAPCEAALDRAAAAGEVVCVEDVACGCPGGLRRGLEGAGLRSMVCVGLIFRGKPVGVMSLYTRGPRQFSQWERGLLQSIGQQLAAAVANGRLLEAQAESERVAVQVKLAADVQRRMLPGKIPDPPGLDIAARYAPSFELGGDFYDLFDLGGHLGLVVGDVVGKGMAAALLMSHVRATLRAHANDIYDMDDVISLTNRALCRDTMDNEFATLFYGVIDPASRRMTYCNAGHEPPLVVHRPVSGAPTDANIAELSTGGMVVGVDPSQRYQRASFDLQSGDVLLAFTDGLPDAMNFDGERFGKPRVRRALLDILGLEPEAPATLIANHVLWEMRRFAGLSPKLDDTTLVVVRVE